MKKFLHYCRVINKDVKNSLKNAICIMIHYVPIVVSVLECTLHLLWATIIFTFVITNPNVPNLGYCSSYYKYLIVNGQAMCTKTKSRILVDFKCTCIYFHLVHFNEIWSGQNLSSKSTFHWKWLWFINFGVQSKDEFTSDRCIRATSSIF